MTFSKSLNTHGLSATAVKAVANPAQALKSTTVDFDQVNVGVATEDNQFLDNGIEESQKLKKEISKFQKDTRNINTQILEAKNNGNNKEQNRLLQEKICIQNEIKIKQEKLNKLITPDGSFNQNTQLKNDFCDRRVTDFGDKPTSTLDLAAVSGFVKNLGIATVGLVVGFGALQGQAHATSFNMISNGEFEETRSNLRGQNGNGRYDYASYQLQYSDWEVSDAYTRHSWLKQQGYSNVDTMGTDGLGTGNFFAGHSTSDAAGISQTFTLAENIETNALFSFDYATFNMSDWSGMRVKIDGTESGSLLNEVIYSTDTSWTEYERELDVVAGEQITVSYYSKGTNGIDDVSFLVDKKVKTVKRKVPESGSILGLVAVSGLVASSLKRKRKSSNIELV